MLSPVASEKVSHDTVHIFHNILRRFVATQATKLSVSFSKPYLSNKLIDDVPILTLMLVFLSVRVLLIRSSRHFALL